MDSLYGIVFTTLLPTTAGPALRSLLESGELWTVTSFEGGLWGK